MKLKVYKTGGRFIVLEAAPNSVIGISQTGNDFFLRLGDLFVQMHNMTGYKWL